MKDTRSPFSRRRLLTAGGASLGLAACATGLAARNGVFDLSPRAPAPVRGAFGYGIRKEAHTLTAESDDVRMYREAVAWMKKVSLENPLDSRGWAQHWAHHSFFCATNTFEYQIHYGWFFLPWHRAYLVNMEQNVRRILNEPAFALPYWDWTKNPKTPDWYWGQGNPLYNTTRLQERGDAVEPDFVELGPVLRATKFEHFGGRRRFKTDNQIEGTLEQSCHNNVHNWTGGEMASFDGAGNDPIFQSHHASIDRLWEIWLAQGEGRKNPTDPEWLNFPFWFYGWDGDPVIIPVRDTLSIEAMGYGYDDLSWQHTLTEANTPRFDGSGASLGTVSATAAEIRQMQAIAQGVDRGRVTLNYARASLPIHPFQHRLFFVDFEGGRSAFAGTFTILPIPGQEFGLEETVTSQVEVTRDAIDMFRDGADVHVVGVPVQLKGRRIPEQPVPFESVFLTVES